MGIVNHQSLPSQAQTQAKGLYDAAHEHDACGVGMVVNIHGNKSHELVDNALKVLENMRHRGAEGADGRTGDGAGITWDSTGAVSKSPKGMVIKDGAYVGMD